MGGHHSQKLRPRRGIRLSSGAQTSGSQRNQHCNENLGGISWGATLSGQPGRDSATGRLGHFWKAGVGHFSRAPKKIRVHAFYCMLGISLLQYVHRQAQVAWAGISMEKLLEELRQIQEFVLLYPPQGEKGPNRVATVLSKQTLPQQALAKTLGLEQLRITPRG